MVQLIIAYAILSGFFMLEFFLRKGETSQSINASPTDNKSTYLIGFTFFAVLLLSALLNILNAGTFKNEALSIIALGLMCAGLLIRIWSMQTLKKYYTRTLITTEEQEIIKKGPYKIIRHPGYLGTMLIWCAAGLAMQNYIITCIAIIMMSIAYTYRIQNEERMLSNTFGEKFNDYKKNTWRIIPLFW